MKQKTIDTSIIKAKNYWQMLGPGLTTGAADDDPSGIATYTQAGATAGFGFLWTAFLTFPLMVLVQEMCARIGIVTGRGLAGSIRNHYARWVIYSIASLLFVANTFNIGADLALMGQVGVLLTPKISPLVYILLFSLISVALQIFTSYKDYARYLKWLALILLAYVVSAFRVPVDWGSALYHTFVPHIQFTKESMFLLTAIIGTTISPYLFFWQTSQEVEQQILEGKKTIKQRAEVTTVDDIHKMRLDVTSGMFVSNIVMFFIIVASAATLFNHDPSQNITAASATKALQPVAGNLAYLMFALGVIGTGMLAIPVLAGSSSYAISESLGWKEGLYRKFNQAYAFYGVIIVSVALGIIINLFHIDPIRTLLYSSLVNGIVAPFILIMILLLSSNKKIMGIWVNKKLISIVGWVVVMLMFLVSLFGIMSLL